MQKHKENKNKLINVPALTSSATSRTLTSEQ
jgi:hypothetical protein